MKARLLFNASAIVEILTGCGLLVVPALVIRLMLGSELDQVGFAVARILGAALLALGIAAWEVPRRAPRLTTRAGICVFNIGAAALLVVFAVFGGLAGALLWPIALFHGVLAAAMVWAMLSASRDVATQ
jgi:hypothetical protein